MDEVLRWAGVLLCIWFVYQGIILMTVLVQLLRTPVTPVKVLLDFDAPAKVDLLTSDQQAWLDELRDLGFELMWSGTMERGLSARLDPIAVAYLQHRDEPVMATVTFCASLLSIYPVQFVSEDAQGRLLITQNRLGFMGLSGSDEALVKDVYLPALADHLAAHRERLDPAAQPLMQPAAIRRMAERMAGRAEAWFDLQRQRGQLVSGGDGWHYGLMPAIRIAWAMMRVRRQLLRPYQSRVTRGQHQASFLAQCYLFNEQLLSSRPARHNVKAAVLVLSMGLTLVLWGWAFDWVQALALMAILLVHEGGHALAMRWFGWKDMSMFFVPFMGAMVTGRPASIAAWKQAIVLLAGPMPGLLAGAAYLYFVPPVPDAAIDWQRVASLAVAINLFNLLPLSPLDGGQLIDGIVFRRWPRMRMGFVWMSWLAFLAMAIYTKQPVFWGLLVWLGMMLLVLWRVSRIDMEAEAGQDLSIRVRALFEQARTLFPTANAFRLHAIVKSLIERKIMSAPRWWESAGVLGVLVAVWGGSALGYAGMVSNDTELGDHLTSAQRHFDQAWYRDFGDAVDADNLKSVQDAARGLEPKDPRLFDLAVREAEALPLLLRRDRLAALVRSGRDGQHETASGLLSNELDRVWRELGAQPPDERVPAMRDAVAWAEQISPKDLRSTIDLRLRLIEADDERGNTDQARQALEALRERAEHDEGCRCAMRPIIRAQSWFYMSHGDAPQALRVLETSRYIQGILGQHDSLSMDYGWMLLFNGKTQPGIKMIKAAAYTAPYDPDWVSWLKGARSHPAQIDKALDLAYALKIAGQDGEVHAVLNGDMASFECAQATGGRLYEDRYPWQRERDRLLKGIALAHCRPVRD